MTQRDLRVGNYMINFLGEVFQVNGMTIADWGVPSEFKKPEPIKLTSDWCDKFHQLIPTYDSDKFYINNEIYIELERNFVMLGRYIIFHCEYVHQLQNFYRDIIQQELTIKP
jgi:hypothetical protein